MIHDLLENSRKAGSSTLMDILNDNRLLLKEHDQLIEKKVDTARAAVAVFRALGGGWNLSQNNFFKLIREVKLMGAFEK